MRTGAVEREHAQSAFPIATWLFAAVLLVAEYVVAILLFDAERLRPLHLLDDCQQFFITVLGKLGSRSCLCESEHSGRIRLGNIRQLTTGHAIAEDISPLGKANPIEVRVGSHRSGCLRP